jgi:zinc-ribbon domain
MAKFCTNCGHELREGAKFCSECETPVRSETAPGSLTGWEYCEIKCEPRIFRVGHKGSSSILALCFEFRVLKRGANGEGKGLLGWDPPMSLGREAWEVERARWEIDTHFTNTWEPDTDAAPDMTCPELNAEAKECVEELVRRLTIDGWEHLPDKTKNADRETEWFGYRFRRLVRS